MPGNNGKKSTNHFTLKNYEHIFQFIETNPHAAKKELETEIRKLQKLKKAKEKIDEKIISELTELNVMLQKQLPKKARPFIHEAMLKELRGHDEDALTKYANIRERFPNNAHAYLYAADILKKQKKYSEGETLLKKYLSQNLRSAGYHKMQITSKAEDLLSSIEEARKEDAKKELQPFKFSKDRPMHAFFADIAKKHLLFKQGQGLFDQVLQTIKEENVNKEIKTQLQEQHGVSNYRRK